MLQLVWLGAVTPLKSSPGAGRAEPLVIASPGLDGPLAPVVTTLGASSVAFSVIAALGISGTEAKASVLG